MHTTAIIRPKTIGDDAFGQLVHVDADPSSEQLKRAVAGFLAGYSGQTMNAYRIDLNKFIAWLDSRGVGVFEVERAHHRPGPGVLCRQYRSSCEPAGSDHDPRSGVPWRADGAWSSLSGGDDHRVAGVGDDRRRGRGGLSRPRA